MTHDPLCRVPFQQFLGYRFYNKEQVMKLFHRHDFDPKFTAGPWLYSRCKCGRVQERLSPFFPENTWHIFDKTLLEAHK